MKILLTGATGFLGSHIAETLSTHGHELLLAKRTKSDLWRCASLENKVKWTNSDSDTFELDVLSFRPNVIINSAWNGVSAGERNSWKHQLDNLCYQQRLLDLAKRLEVKVFIGIGSQAEYGTFDGCVDENYIADPNTAYGVVKLAAQQIVKTFCEENNITWAKKLEKAGCHVIYGVIGLKTHCKILLIVRKEKDKIKRYVHFGTGNYNDVTAKFYTDMGILTADETFGADASILFNMLSGYAAPNDMKKITIAPYGFRNKFEEMIRRETQNAKQGKKAKIIAKMNSLLDKSITTELYAASQAGVEIELIVRGICCLKPGIKGLSENIKVRSIVGRYLEHSRIYYFYNDGKEEIYISSGDWMYRNLNKRVETMGIVEDSDIQQEIKEILDLYLKDNVKAKILQSDGSYKLNNIKENEKRVNAQEELVKFTHNKNKNLEKEFSQTIIIPMVK